MKSLVGRSTTFTDARAQSTWGVSDAEPPPQFARTSSILVARVKMQIHFDRFSVLPSGFCRPLISGPNHMGVIGVLGFSLILHRAFLSQVHSPRFPEEPERTWRGA